MKISIITVVFNGEKTIKDTIESVLTQNYDNIEYIIIDGNSTDSTTTIIKKYQDKIQKFVSETDKGVYDAMNKGITLANGEIIGILNADDIYNSPFIISQVIKMFDDSKADAVYGDLLYVKFDDLNIIKRNWKAGEYKPGLFLWGWMPPHPSFFLRKSWYTNYGLFRLDLNSAADYELMLRMVHKFKAKIAYIPEVIVKMRIGGMSNNTLANRILANKNDQKAWKVNNITPYPFTTLLKPIRKILQFIK